MDNKFVLMPTDTPIVPDGCYVFSRRKMLWVGGAFIALLVAATAFDLYVIKQIEKASEQDSAVLNKQLTFCVIERDAAQTEAFRNIFGFDPQAADPVKVEDVVDDLVHQRVVFLQIAALTKSQKGQSENGKRAVIFYQNIADELLQRQIAARVQAQRWKIPLFRQENRAKQLFPFIPSTGGFNTGIAAWPP